jgi:NTP pyrophosphatase (non-canonical NTP hydrolase)
MNPTDYQKQAERTECDQDKASRRRADLDDPKRTATRLEHAAIGLAAEAGEVLSLIENWIYYGQDLDVLKMKEELGDCCWRIAEACNALGLDFGEVLAANNRKLKVRFPEAYSDTACKRENRDRIAERKAIEGEGPLADYLDVKERVAKRRAADEEVRRRNTDICD